MFDAIVDNIIDSKPEKVKKEASCYHEFLDEFVEETREHLITVEKMVLEFEEKSDKTSINKLFREMHTIKGLAGFVNQEPIERIAHKVEESLVKYREIQKNPPEIISTKILKSVDLIETICQHLETFPDKEFMEKIDIFLENFDNEITEVKMENMDKEKEKRKKDKETFIKLPASKIDDIIEKADKIMNLSLSEGANQQSIAKLSKELKNNVISLKRGTLKPIFHKIKLLIRAMSRKENKDIELLLSGETIEINRNIIDSLNEIILHILRNSVSHGIHEKGKITVYAYKDKNRIYIEISDEGKGLDVDMIYKRAIQKKIISSSKNYTEDDIFNLIFLPGFTTTKKSDMVSGRGMGMDIVKKKVDKIGGKVEIKSIKGEGVKFTIIFPDFFGINSQ